MAKTLNPEAQRFAEEFLAERARQRAAMIEQAGFPPPMPVVTPAAPAEVLDEEELLDEDLLAEQILARLDAGLPTTAEERRYLRRMLFAVPGEDDYVPATLRAMPPEEKLLLDARLLTIDRAARLKP